MTIPFEFAQRPITIGDHTERWRIRKSGLTFTCFRDDEHLETGDARAAVEFFVGDRDADEVRTAARDLVATVDEALGQWPPQRR